MGKIDNKQAINHLRNTINLLEEKEKRFAEKQIEYADYKLNPFKFVPNKRAKMWGVVIQSEKACVYVNNLTFNQANRDVESYLSGIADDCNQQKITGIWVVAEHNGIFRK